jgi:uncharacterized protein involved in exopolysaccharide biosynthesis
MTIRPSGTLEQHVVVHHHPDPAANHVNSPGSRPFSLIEMLSLLVLSWRLIVLLPVAFATVVGALTLRVERSYTASASFLPLMAETRSTGGAVALAQQLGMTLGGEPGVASPQFYVDVLRSRAVLRQVVEGEYEIRSLDGQTLVGNLIDFYEIEDKPELPPPWRQAVDRLRPSLTTSVSGTGVVQLTVSASEPELAEQIAERMLGLLNEFNISIRRDRAEVETRFIADRADAARGELRVAEDGLQSFLDRNPQYRNSPAMLFEYERLQRQMVIRQEVYTSLLRAHEQKRIDAIRDTPVLMLLDHPAGTAEPQPRGTIIRTFLAALLGLVIAVLFVLGRDLLRRSREGDPHYRELQAVAHGAWRDIRSPIRWVGVARSSASAGKNQSTG